MDINKPVRNFFFQFEEDSKILSFWEYGFEDYLKYESIYLINSKSYQLVQ